MPRQYDRCHHVLALVHPVALGGVVGRLDARDIDERPERRLKLQDLLAHASRLLLGACDGITEESTDLRSHVCPAWARSGGESPLRKLATATASNPQGDGREVGAERSGKRNCGPTNRNRIRGGAEQGERACNREALVAKLRQRKSGGRAGKIVTPLPGEISPHARKGDAGVRAEREVSRGRSSRAEIRRVANPVSRPSRATKDQTDGRVRRP